MGTYDSRGCTECNHLRAELEAANQRAEKAEKETREARARALYLYDAGSWMSDTHGFDWPPQTDIEQQARAEREEDATCEQCGGSGAETVPEHAPDCEGECRNCPVPVQTPCDRCQGTGRYPCGAQKEEV